MAKQREAMGLDNRGKWRLLSGMTDIFIPHEIRPDKDRHRPTEIQTHTDRQTDRHTETDRSWLADPTSDSSTETQPDSTFINKDRRASGWLVS